MSAQARLSCEEELALTAENARLRADNLRLVNDLDAEGVRLGMLRAENARLRAEVAACPHLQARINELQALYEVTEANRRRLTADLARVSGERDGLVKAARARLDIAARVDITPYGDNPAWIAVVADWEAAENALLAAVAACTPPASGCRPPGCTKPATTSLGNCMEHWGEGSDDSAARPAPAKEKKR